MLAGAATLALRTPSSSPCSAPSSSLCSSAAQCTKSCLQRSAACPLPWVSCRPVLATRAAAVPTRATLGVSFPLQGQVQDVGLVFLSALASAVVAQCQEAGWLDEDTLATVLVSLVAATGIVGVLVMVTGVPMNPIASHCEAIRASKASWPGSAAPLRAGALKVAGLVQYVPLPVVGGYLCFVGYFCLAAGELGPRCCLLWPS